MDPDWVDVLFIKNRDFPIAMLVYQSEPQQTSGVTLDDQLHPGGLEIWIASPIGL